LIDDAGAVEASGERAKATGVVLDSTGKPLDRATVLVYEARVSKGYSPFCPTCWADCGKHVLTDASGRFQIDDLRAGLKFKLLALKSGYSAAFVENVDPSNGPAPTVTLKSAPRSRILLVSYEGGWSTASVIPCGMPLSNRTESLPTIDWGAAG